MQLLQHRYGPFGHARQCAKEFLVIKYLACTRASKLVLTLDPRASLCTAGFAAGMTLLLLSDDFLGMHIKAKVSPAGFVQASHLPPLHNSHLLLRKPVQRVHHGLTAPRSLPSVGFRLPSPTTPPHPSSTSSINFAASVSATIMRWERGMSLQVSCGRGGPSAFGCLRCVSCYRASLCPKSVAQRRPFTTHHTPALRFILQLTCSPRNIATSEPDHRPGSWRCRCPLGMKQHPRGWPRC